MENQWWWPPLILAIQALAAVLYITGSRRFYRCHNTGQYNYLKLLVGAVTTDIVLTALVHASLADAPWESRLFLSHLILAGGGLLGFTISVLYMFFKGRYKRGYYAYSRLRPFQYRVLLPMWCAGVGIGLANFISKVAFGVRLYDLL